MTKRITVSREDLQRLFDAVCNSLDFGSGFLESADVDTLRRIAAQLGVDPNKATPSEFKRNYPHKYTTYPNGDYCRICFTGVDTPLHVDIDTENAALMRYYDALASGLSDYEAREEGWPSNDNAS